jgi:hypothetical protein
MQDSRSCRFPKGKTVADIVEAYPKESTVEDAGPNYVYGALGHPYPLRVKPVSDLNEERR